MSKNPGVEVAKAMLALDRARTSFEKELRMDGPAHALLAACEQQQVALEAIWDRLQQHFNGGNADHPEFVR